MLPNVPQELYLQFKRTYRLTKYTESQVTTIPEIVQLAYLDVNRTIKGIDSAQSEALKQTIVSFIKNLLKASPPNQMSFDKLHRECCYECLSYSSNEGARVHYGQAQKLLNMSLKYLYNEYALSKGKSNLLGFPENDLEHLFHLPIDSQIRNHLIEKCGFVDPKPLPWSRWNYDHYMSFQSQLRRRLRPQFRPLEIDYLLCNIDGASLDRALVDHGSSPRMTVRSVYA